MKDSPYFFVILKSRCPRCALVVKADGFQFSTSSPSGHRVFSQRGRKAENRYDTIQTCADTPAPARNFCSGCISEFGTAGFFSVWQSMLYLPTLSSFSYLSGLCFSVDPDVES